MSNHGYGNLTSSARERSNSQLKRSSLVQQGFARRTFANRSNEAVHVSRNINMAIDTPDIEDQEQWKDYDIAAKGITHK
jgi:hypothetical protein